MDGFQKNMECPFCGKIKPIDNFRSAEMIHTPVQKLIKEKHPDWDSGHMICQSCLSRFRSEYVEDVLEEQRGELTALEDKVIESLKEQDLLSQNIDPLFDSKLTFGQRLADRVASFGGSWSFIIIFGATLLIWIGINSLLLLKRPFDPYPYILLNLVLSCLAAIQAPIIMMSQNRQEAKDRLRGEHDYQVNLKAEIEIRQLHIKLDQLMNHSWQRLLEIQKIQMDIMEDMAQGPTGPGDSEPK